MNAYPLPPAAFLHECFTYDPITGEVFWKERPPHHFETPRGWNLFNAKFAGKVAGHHHTDRDGAPSGIRMCFTISGHRGHIYAHRIIYSLMGIEIPEGYEVDHKDVNPFNNSWVNLRLATKAQNGQNRKGWKNRSLPKWVTPNEGCGFKSHIVVNGERIYLGTFSTPELAHAAASAKAAEMSGEFARFN